MKRTGFIGGSDLYTILNGDWAELYDIKMGLTTSPDLSGEFNVQLGTFTERFNINWMCKTSGYESHHRYEGNADATIEQQEFSKTISGVPYKGQLDDILISNGERFVCEAKHTNSFKTMKQMLGMYLPQMHLYMRLSGIHKCVFTVIFGNRHEWCIVDYDEEYWKQIHNYVVQFWSFVEKGVRPAASGSVGIDWSDIKIDGLSIRDASQDNQFVDAAHTYINASESYNRCEQAKKDLKALVSDTEREVFCDLLTIKRDKRGSLRIKIKEDATEA